mmetsp:Transcript_7554/g.24947  ORF Transcript_7554/g.24947 Transcript_7554/m.24947 type:complete len:294 (-) Transcript_7554:103-984(-)
MVAKWLLRKKTASSASAREACSCTSPWYESWEAEPLSHSVSSSASRTAIESERRSAGCAGEGKGSAAAAEGGGEGGGEASPRLSCMACRISSSSEQSVSVPCGASAAAAAPPATGNGSAAGNGSAPGQGAAASGGGGGGASGSAAAFACVSDWISMMRSTSWLYEREPTAAAVAVSCGSTSQPCSSLTRSKSKMSRSSEYSSPSTASKRTLTSSPRPSFGKSAMASVRLAARSGGEASVTGLLSSMYSASSAVSSDCATFGAPGRGSAMEFRRRRTLHSARSGQGPLSPCMSM